jgi:hypothetical protein
MDCGVNNHVATSAKTPPMASAVLNAESSHLAITVP